MHLRKWFSVLVVAAALALPLWAQQAMSDDEYDATMKQIRATVGGANDHITARAGADVAADGTALAESFAKVQAFWEAREREDATGWAAAALEAARDLESAGGAGNFEAAATAFGNLRGACMPCHTQYRERTEDGFRIKSGS